MRCMITLMSTAKAFRITLLSVFVKILPEIAEMMHDAERGYPYDGAKEHYILDIEDRGLLERVIPVLEANTPLPRPRKKKTEAKTEK